MQDAKFDNEPMKQREMARWNRNQMELRININEFPDGAYKMYHWLKYAPSPIKSMFASDRSSHHVAFQIRWLAILSARSLSTASMQGGRLRE
jgi:hypothetical protein